MKGRSLLYTAFLILVPCILFSQEKPDDALLRRLVLVNGQAEVAVPISGGLNLRLLTSNFSVSAVKEKKIYIRLSPLTVEHFISGNYGYEIIDIEGGKGMLAPSDMSEVMTWEKYPTYTQYDSIMRSFQVRFPTLCHLDTIGISNYGKLILVLKISDNHFSDEAEPEVFYSSSIHGDETGGFILMLRLCEYLMENYSVSAKVKDLVDNLEIWINPLANPDGMYRTGNVISSPTRFNANGYDLNRNFPDPLVTGVTRQKETIDMMRFLAERRFVVSANFHSGTEVVNYPWDRWLEKLHADDLWFYQLSRAYADTVHVNSIPGYMTELDNGITRGAVWYVITGGRQDYVTYDLQGREVTIELDDNYITPVSQLESLWQYNYRSLLNYLESAMYGIHGTVTDALTGQPVAAMITIPGHDKDNSQIFTDSTTGHFARLLSPQLWTMKFTADGYYDTTVYNIPVQALQKTGIEVKMVPVINAVDTMKPEKALLYPNPASNIVRAVLPEALYGQISTTIFNSSGVLVYTSDYEAVYGFPLQIDISNLSAGSYYVVFKNNITGVTSSGQFIVVRK